MLQGGNDAKFVFGTDPSEDHFGVGGERLDELVGAHGVELGSADDARVGAGDEADLSGDGFSGDTVVAGVHDDPDAGVAAGGDGVDRLGTGWVHHGYETEVGQAPLGGVLVGVIGVEVTVGDGNDSQGFARQSVVGLADLLAVAGGERAVAAVPGDRGAAAEQFLR